MRNSPFQLKNTSVTKTIQSNAEYKHHRKNIDAMNSRSRSPKDFITEIEGKRQSLVRTRKFELASKFRDE